MGGELAQAHRRLGSAVTLFEAATILPKDDPELVAVVRAGLEADGVAVREGSRVVGIEPAPSGIRVVVDREGRREPGEGSHLLGAGRRRRQVAKLRMEEAGGRFCACGIGTTRPLAP